MNTQSSPKKSTFFASIFSALKPGQKLREEKARLEAFLDAFPGEYCGLSHDGINAAYSKGFCRVMGLERIKTFEDIQNQLKPGDAAALESMYDRLYKHKTPFSFTAQTINNKTIKLSGSHGRDPMKQERFNIFWVEEVKGNSAKVQKEKTDEPPAAAPQELTQMQTALNSIPRPLWLRDSKQAIVWANSTYTEYLNIPLQEVLEKQSELASPQKTKSGELAPGPPLAHAAITQGTAVETKAHGVFAGNRLLMKLSEIPLNPLGMTLGIAYNITREEELETQLKRYEASNKDLLGQMRSAIAIFSADQKLEFHNQAFSQLWDLEDGWLNTAPTLGEIMETLRDNRRLPEQSDFRKFKKTWLAMFTDLIDPHEDMLFLPDGSTYRMLVVPHSLGGLMMNFEDVTGRLALESSYNTLIAVQRETLDNLVEGIAVYGGDGRLKLWNPAFASLWSLHPEDLDAEPHITKLAEKMKNAFPKEEWNKCKAEILANSLERDAKHGRCHLKDGALIEYNTVPLPDGGVLISYTDITDTVNVEKALREKNTALEAAERLKMDFLANVSYQLRTPLNAIMGFTEILDQEYFGALNERQKEYTRDMKDASNRLVTLIDDILDLSTLEAGYMNLQRETIKIHDMVSAIHALMEDWARKEKIEIEVKCPKNIGTLNGDEKRLKQAIVNIIRNSITFTPAGGKISLTASRKKEGLQITIHDTGIGVTEEDKLRIFEPFERAQTGAISHKLTRSGAGLGLSLVKNILALHNGTVTLESQPDQGTTITLFIPFLSTKTALKLPVGDHHR